MARRTLCLAIALVAAGCGGDASLPADPQMAGGTRTPADPMATSPSRGALGVAAGAQRSCAIESAGRVSCWGGTELAADRVPSYVQGTEDTVQVVVGGQHACARSSLGEVRCWGQGAVVDAEDLETYHAPELVDLGDVAELASGRTHVCARVSSGSVFCWGANQRGQLGTDHYENTPLPQLVTGLDDAVLLAAGSDDSCAVREGGELVCWGTNYLPLDEYAANAPQVIEGVDAPLSVAVGSDHVCAALANGSVSCWGLNTVYQAGGPESESHLASPTVVEGVDSAELLAAGEAHTCVVRQGAVSCWGKNAEAELGIDRRSDPIREPQPVLGLSDVVQITAGDFHTCVLLASGDLRCWGNNEWGQLGDGSEDTGFTPVSPLLAE